MDSLIQKIENTGKYAADNLTAEEIAQRIEQCQAQKARQERELAVIESAVLSKDAEFQILKAELLGKKQSALQEQMDRDIDDYARELQQTYDAAVERRKRPVVSGIADMEAAILAYERQMEERK